ncbi:hypothetical protein ACSBR2_017440 [Camellia fascicularis]
MHATRRRKNLRHISQRYHHLKKRMSIGMCKLALNSNKVTYLEKLLLHGRKKLYLIRVRQKPNPSPFDYTPERKSNMEDGVVHVYANQDCKLPKF